MVGAIVQHILDRGFLLEYRYGGEGSYGCHVFRMQKRYKGRTFERSWIVADTVLKNKSLQDMAFADCRCRLKQIDEAIIAARLLDEALQ